MISPNITRQNISIQAFSQCATDNELNLMTYILNQQVAYEEIES